MKQVLAACVSAVVLTGAGAAIAASPSVNVPIAPSFNWTGPYVGINGGYGWGNAKTTFGVDGGGGAPGFAPDNVFAPENTSNSFTQSPAGGLAGGQIGFNQQWGPVVFGLEAMFDWSGIDQTSSNVFSGVNPGNSYQTKLRWMAALTPRLGYAWNNWLGYVKAGLAVGEVESNLTGTSTGLPGATSFSQDQDALGWTVGAGVDMAAWRNFIFSLEYDYVDLGSQHFGGKTTPDTTNPVNYTVRTNYSMVLAKLSYKFDGPSQGAAAPADPFAGFSGAWNAPTDWSGPYIGVNGGYGWGNATTAFSAHGAGEFCTDATPACLFAPTQGNSVSQSLSGGIAGGQFGFNQQWSQVVVGLEGTLDWSGLTATTNNVAGTDSMGVSYQTKVKWLATITPRIGYAFANDLVYLKGGLAAAQVQSQVSAPNSAVVAGGQQFSQTHDYIGWTVGIGAETALWQNIVVGVEYDYYGLGSQHFGGRATPDPTFNPTDYKVDASFSSVLARISYKFGSASPPPPAPAPMAAPAPAPARSYLVFFDWDKATLTARAQQIIKEAADNSTKVQYTRIEVNGYTDTSGTPQYNQGLSVRRAQAVAAELVKDGVPKNAIAIQGFGETHLLVPTGPGVREPQNRRVEIIIR